MPIPSWPADLPQNILAQGFKGGLPNNQIRTNMDVGPAQVRRRGTVATKPVTGNIIIDPDKLPVLEEFHKTTLLDGTLRFKWVKPEDGVTVVEMRFTDTPTWDWVDGHYNVTLPLEILP